MNRSEAHSIRRWALAGIVSVAALGACGNGNTTSPATEAAATSPATEVAAASPSMSEEQPTGGPLTIGFVPENIQDPGFRAVQRAMIQQGDLTGDEIVAGDARNSVEEQVSVIENILASDVDCIVIRARNQTALGPATASAAEAGVPVVAIFDTFDGADHVVGFSQSELGLSSGRLGGKFLNDNFGGEGEVVILHADSLGGTTIDRGLGIEEGLTETAPNAEVVAFQEAFTVEDAQEVVAAALQANPDVRLVIGINDASARGAHAALVNAGRDVPEDAGVVAIAGEGTMETLQLIEQGEIYGTTSAVLLEIGAKTVEVCHALADGEDLEEQIEVTPLPVITADNVADQIELIEELNIIEVE